MINYELQVNKARMRESTKKPYFLKETSVAKGKVRTFSDDLQFKR